MKTVIYHSKDLDGIASGAIARKKFPIATNPYLQMIGYDYGEPFDVDSLPSNEGCVMIDVSMPMDVMEAIAKRVGELTWIDHHASAIKDYNSYMKDRKPFMTVVLQDGTAACEIAWNHFFKGQPIPYAIQLLSLYDTWKDQDKVKWNTEILPFQFGARLHCVSVETFGMHFFDEKPTNIHTKIISQGDTVLKYLAITNKSLCEKKSFVVVLDQKIRALCLNSTLFNSGVFESAFDPEKHDVMMPFMYDGKKWSYSLYTTKDEIDCGAIAKTYGGGGHKKAAGFVSDILLF